MDSVQLIFTQGGVDEVIASSAPKATAATGQKELCGPLPHTRALSNHQRMPPKGCGAARSRTQSASRLAGGARRWCVRSMNRALGSEVSTVNLTTSLSPGSFTYRDRWRRGCSGSLALAQAMPQGAQLAASAGATLVNPAQKYPLPPFPEQIQPWPGLASKMTPRPDHGETIYKGSGRLAGRKALITGGDSGMGRAAATAFARKGADVAINYLPAEESDAREVAELITAAGRKAIMIPGDLRDEAFCSWLLANAVQQVGGLDILVNNAAPTQEAQKSILDISTQQFDDTFKRNVYAMFWLTKAAVPHLQPGATIISTASVDACDPGENIIDYAATKSAIMIFTKGLAKQLAVRASGSMQRRPGRFGRPCR
jgi:NAD(P)-dependent dehydrogenase (short-subunit alcohol dehydrogenase family)